MKNLKILLNNYLYKNKNRFLVSDINRSYLGEEFKKKVLLYKKNIKLISKEKNGIGILLERDADYLAAIFACILLGKYYVPLSLRSTKSLIDYQIKTSKINVLITYKDKKKVFFKKIITKEKLKITNKLAYIIFTSGSTGPKKGVAISFKAFEQYIYAIKDKFKKKFKSKSLLINGELTFDITNADLGFALLYNTEICITPDPLNIFSFFLMLEKRKVESIYAVPTAWQNIISSGTLIGKKKFPFIKQINSGGETLSKDLVKKLQKFAPNAKIYNFYGPTEFTINSHTSEIKNKKNLFYKGNATIGKCLRGVNYELINKRKLKNNIIEGELVLTGKQLMEGYINSEENIFKILRGKKYYMTGDSFIINKNYFFFNGRLKDYIKISGYRVNIIDLENRISSKFNTNVYFCFIKNELILFSINKELKKNIVNFIYKNFEWYEKPKKIIFIKEFPTLSNGKIDKKKLNYE